MSVVRPTLAAWKVRILLSTWIAYAGLYFCRKAFYVAKSSLGISLDVPISALATVGTVYLVAYTVGQFLCAGLGAKIGPRYLLLGGMALSIVCNIMFGVGNSVESLTLFMALNGLAQASGWPSCIGTLASWTRRDERGVLLGLWSTCYQVGGVAANAFAAFWLARAGFRGSFFAASVVLFLAWLVVAYFQRNAPEDVGYPPVADDDVSAGSPAQSDDGPIWTRSLIISVLLVGAFYFGVKFVRYALWSWTPYFLERNFGMKGDDAGYLSTVFDIAGFFGAMTAGFLSDRVFGGRRARVAFFMLLGMVGATALLAFVGASGVVPFAIGLGLVGFTLYGPDSLLTGAGAIDLGSRRAALAAAGIINGMGSLGSVAQETIVAAVYADQGQDVTSVLRLLFGAGLLSVFALAVVLWRNKRGLSDV